MSKFHINPETGKPNRCTAKKKCKYAVDGVEPKHYNSFDEAAKAYEQENSMKNLESLTRGQKDFTDTASMSYVKMQGYEQSIDLYEKYSLLRYGKGHWPVKDKIGGNSAKKIEQSFADKNYLDYDVTRVFTVGKNSGNSDVYLSDEDGHFINGKLNVPNDNILKVSERLNMRRQLFDKGWEKESNISGKINDVELLRDPAPKVKISSLNDKFTDDDIDRISQTASDKNVHSSDVHFAGTLLNSNSDESEKMIEKRMKSSIYKNDEERESAREFFTFIHDYSNTVQKR